MKNLFALSILSMLIGNVAFAESVAPRVIMTCDSAPGAATLEYPNGLHVEITRVVSLVDGSLTQKFYAEISTKQAEAKVVIASPEVVFEQSGFERSGFMYEGIDFALGVSNTGSYGRVLGNTSHLNFTQGNKSINANFGCKPAR